MEAYLDYLMENHILNENCFEPWMAFFFLKTSEMTGKPIKKGVTFDTKTNLKKAVKNLEKDPDYLFWSELAISLDQEDLTGKILVRLMEAADQPRPEILPLKSDLMHPEGQKQLLIEDERLLFVMTEYQARIYDLLKLELLDNYDFGDTLSGKKPLLL